MPGWTVVVDRELCIGSGVCVVYAPGTFTHDDEAKAIVVEEPSDPVKAVRSALSSCPTAALQLTEDKGE